MEGSAHWLDMLVVAGGGAAVLGLVLLLSRPFKFLTRKRQQLECPKLHRRVECVLVENNTSKQVVNVVSCSAFDDPEAVTCAKSCVAQQNAVPQVTAS